jgi:hypothetical protein
VNPLLSRLALVPGGLIIVTPFITVYRAGGRIRSMQQAAGIPPNVVPIIGLLSMFVFSTYNLYYHISLNGTWTKYGNQPENTPAPIKS